MAEEITALIIEHTIKVGEEKRYEKWTADILEAVSQSPGYLGREVFPAAGAGKPYTIIVRFQSQAHSNKWLESPVRRAFVAQINNVIETGDKTTIKAGIDVWFTPESAAQKPPAYKQFLLTWAAIFPLSIIVPLLLSPLVEILPILKAQYVAGLIGTGVITALMTYLIMPNLTRWMHGWLFASNTNNVSERHTENL